MTTPKSPKPAKKTKPSKAKSKPKTAPNQETDQSTLSPDSSKTEQNTKIDTKIVNEIQITDEDDLTTVDLDAPITKLTDNHLNINPEAFLNYCTNEVSKYIQGMRKELTANHISICSNRRNIRAQRVKELSKANMASCVSFIMDLYTYNPSIALMVTRALEQPEKQIKDVVAESLDEVVANGYDATDIFKQ